MRGQAQRALDEAEGATDEQKQPLQQAIGEAETALSGSNDKERFESLTQDLAQKLQAFQQETAAQQAQGQETAADVETGAAGTAEDDDVIDADFKPAG